MSRSYGTWTNAGTTWCTLSFSLEARMRLSIDPDADALYLKLREGSVHETRELLDMRLIVDLDQNGSLLGVEILGISTDPDDSGFRHVDVAFASGVGRVIEFDPEQMRDEEEPAKAKQGRIRTG